MSGAHAAGGERYEPEPRQTRTPREGIFTRKGKAVIFGVVALAFAVPFGPGGALIGLGLCGVVTWTAFLHRKVRAPLRYAASAKMKTFLFNNPDHTFDDPEVDAPSHSVPTPQGDAQGPRTYPLRDPQAQTYLTWLNEAYRATTPEAVDFVIKKAQYQPADVDGSPQAKALRGVIYELAGLATAGEVRALIDKRLAPFDAAARNLAPPPRPTAPPRRRFDRDDGLTRFGSPGQQEFSVGGAAGGINPGAGGSLDIN